MLLVAFFGRIFKISKKIYSDKEELSHLNSATLTLLDISCDASLKIATSLAPEKSETLLSIFPIIQSIFSFICFNQKLTTLEFLGMMLQVVGYITISSSPVGLPIEPIHPTPYYVLGIESIRAGYIFLVLSIFLKCISMTIVQSLHSTDIKLSALSFCSENGFFGIIITTSYHLYISLTHKEQILTSPIKSNILIALIFILSSAIKHYTQFWLILNTSAVEHSRITTLAMLFNFIVRHYIYREDALTYGYSAMPLFGVALALLGFNLMGLTQDKNRILLMENECDDDEFKLIKNEEEEEEKEIEFVE